MKNHGGWLACALALGAAGCEGSAPDQPKRWGPEAAVELGLQSVGAFVKNEILDHPDDYTHRISLDSYEGVTLIQVTRSYDITDVSDDAHEQILRLSTSSDYEEFSTWDSLRMGQAAIGGPEPFEYSIALKVPAELSANVTTQNGILEIDPSTEDILHVEWEYPAEDDKVSAGFLLAPVD